MSGQQGISGRLGSHRAVPQDAMGQHGKHGLTIRALNAPDGETTQPDTGIVGVAGQAPALAAAGLVEELKAEREEKREHELDKDLREGRCDTTPLSLFLFMTKGCGLLWQQIASARDSENFPLP